MSDSSNPVTPPRFPDNLITEPAQTNPAPQITPLGPLEHLVGTWSNKNLGDSGDGGPADPFSYNLMPLPSFAATEKYILKNFKYYEEITFSPINGNAPNRGGNYQQNANVLFYEQRVYFAEGPDKDKLVHAENGSWLFLDTATQATGPYGTTPEETPPSPFPKQNPRTNIAKQISVPHGNSILVQGGVTDYPGSYVQKGPLTIPNYEQAITPMGIDLTPYSTNSVGNPHPELNLNPNAPLQKATGITPCTNFIHWNVDSKNPEATGHVTNIPFEMQKANVVDYSANYWLQSFDNGDSFTQLSYNQTILMDIPINGNVIKFPHITCNVMTKKD